MPHLKNTLFALLCIALLGACGLKGPLYLPEEEQAPLLTTQQEQEEETEAGDKEEDSGGKGKF